MTPSTTANLDSELVISKMNFTDQSLLIHGLSALIDQLKDERAEYRSLLEANKGISPGWNRGMIKERDEKIRRCKQLIHIVSTSR